MASSTTHKVFGCYKTLLVVLVMLQVVWETGATYTKSCSYDQVYGPN
jgi:hypothetical protein